MYQKFINNIFSVTSSGFDSAAKAVFNFQYQNNFLYNKWCNLIYPNTDPKGEEIPPSFLPISFFKTHKVITTRFEEQQIFESSGTTNTINSKHFVKDISLYKTSAIKAFEMFYGDMKDWCVIGLLPSYLERQNSSLIMMVDDMIKKSCHKQSGFYLYEFDKLKEVLLELERKQQKTLLIGVTFALLDFAELDFLQLKNTIVMETGGMKGRRRELTRNEIHSFLKERLGVKSIHSEYGMTELLSQAYSKGDGRFLCPPWMKVLVRDEEDPLQIKPHGKGVLNIIDLANVYSCSFIATDDLGIVYEDGSFEVLGRLDNCDIRGCSLLVV